MSMIVSSCQHCDEQQFQLLSCVHYSIFSVVKLDLFIRALKRDHTLALRTPRVHFVLCVGGLFVFMGGPFWTCPPPYENFCGRPYLRSLFKSYVSLNVVQKPGLLASINQSILWYITFFFISV